MEDYAFFAQIWQWGPEDVDYLRWSHRKQLKQAYKDNLVNEKK